MLRIANPPTPVRFRPAPPQLAEDLCFLANHPARVVKLVDTTDLKSVDHLVVPVQVRPRAPFPPSNFGVKQKASCAFDVVCGMLTPLFLVLIRQPIKTIKRQGLTMLKKAAFSCLIISASSVSLAADTAYYVGMDAFFGSQKQTYDASGNETSESASAGGGSINLGYRFTDNDRFEVEFTKVESEIDSDDTKMEGIDFDWSFVVLPQSSFYPYLEAGFGLYEYKQTKSLSDDNENLGGIAINFGFGAIYELEKSIELDASYRFKGIGWEETKFDQKISNDIGKLVLGARILF